MALLITRNGSDWTTAHEGEGASGPCVGFDTVLGRPVWRHPSGTSWVDALGNVVAGVVTGRLSLDSAENSALIALL